MYGIEFTRSAEKSFLKISKKEQFRISNALDKLVLDPMIGKPLKGSLKDFWSLRIGNYRVIYYIQKDKLLIMVFDVRHRREVYRQR
ncbi:MAG: type II toxin-antitoxin system RelE/ParE family toxin [Candidatus Pacebacteria bacterium CG10_big_fil_rev_8_21_14_0_10_42_12]|nr:type II toxin-antitoxin system RelE/ParE family toxin [Candidatus Paceibacterota bacterium]PIR62217.1 MAG: type II toxin-antitoxin system RelE/ParE family toxin [Candidatus Pacebacteria bacterium CG10_big_fil_rev_8_21_14_0_10_42_12]